MQLIIVFMLMIQMTLLDIVESRISLGRYQNENQYLIDDNIRKLAVDFGVDPIEILGHVLEYKIEWK